MSTEALLPRYHRQVCLISRAVTLVLLSTSILLTLLVLLTPTPHEHLSFFSLVPTSPAKESAVSPTNSTVTAYNATNTTVGTPLDAVNSSYDGFPSREFDDDEHAEEKREDESPRTFEPPKPSIWVGALQICSQSSDTAEIACISTSNPANSSTLLSSNFGVALLKVPKSPITPVLLLVSGVCALIATSIYLWHIFDCSFLAKRLRAVRRRYVSVLRRHPHIRDHTRRGSRESIDSMTLLVNSSGQPVDSASGKPCNQKNKTHYAFLVFAVPAFCLSLAGTVIQLVQVAISEGAWDKVEAERVGMKFERGTLVYLMPILPVVILIALFTAYTPAVYNRFGSRSDVESIVIVQNHASTTPSLVTFEDVKTDAHVSDQWTEANAHSLTSIPEAEKSKYLENEDDRRNTFGTIGAAL